MRLHGASDGLADHTVRDATQRAASAGRNLFGTPEQGDLYHGFGPEQPERTELMLRRLARRMVAEELHRHDNADNSNIPAGYTYLAQFAAHDLLQDAPDLQRRAPAAAFRQGRRGVRLMLDTLYGGGPHSHPIAYALPKGGTAQRTQLRLGRIREGAKGYLRCAARDIPRTGCPHLNDDPGRGSPDVLLVDPRNDDNLILSQLTALFHILHNHLDIALVAVDGTPEDDHRRFLAVRRVMTLVYRNILRKDLLRRLLNRRIYGLYASAKRRFLDCGDDSRLPLEFTHAAFRIGHVMVRSVYRLNDKRRFVGLKDVLRNTSAARPFDMPLTRDWLLQWRYFFEIGSEAPQLSRRLEPSIAPTLAGSALFGSDDTGFGDLLWRDLSRASACGLRTLDSIIRTLKRELPGEALASTPLLSDSDERAARIRNWLIANGAGANAMDDGFNSDDLERLSHDPPLLFFVLFEAAQAENGERLGLLGSVILAEVFLGALAETRDLIEDDPETRTLAARHFGNAIPETMPQLIRYLANAEGLANAESMFI